MREVAVLNLLSSTTTPYTPEHHHKIAFEQLKKLLTTTPLYSNIADPRAKKLLFVDSSDRGIYAAVLEQMQEIHPGRIHIPEYLILDDPVDRIIFGKQLVAQLDLLPFWSISALIIVNSFKTINQRVLYNGGGTRSATYS